MKNKSTSSISLRKLMLSALVAAPLATLPSSLWALPASQTALNTQINSTTSGVTATWINANQVSISSTASNSVIKWANFGDATNNTIGATDLIVYNMPSSSAAILNLVQGSSATTIDGSLVANGNIFVLNPNGITVSGTGKITANGVVLSTVPEAEFFFLANGNLSYVGSPTTGVSVATGAAITAASGTGNVYIAGKTANLAGGIDAGNLTVNAIGGNAVLGSGGNLVVGATGKAAVVNVSANGGGTITVGDAVANSNVTLTGGSATLTTANAAITQVGTGSLLVGSGSADATLNVNAGTGAITLTKVNANSAGKVLTVNATGAATSITSTAEKLTVGLTTSGNTTVASAADLGVNASNVGGNLSLTTTGGKITSGGNVTLAAGKTLTLSATGDITYKSIGDVDFTGGGLTVAAGSALSLTSTTGNIVLPAFTAKSLSATAAKDITSAAAIVASTAGSTLDAGGMINLTNADFGTGGNGLTIKNAPSGATVTDPNALALANGTNATGDVTLNTTGALAFGNASGDTIAVAGNLTATTGGNAVTQVSDNTTILGKLTINAGAGAVTLAGSTGKGTGLKNQYGQVNVTAASATIFEQTSLNLGAITTTGNLVAYSATSITNSGQLKITGTTTVGAGTAAAPGSIDLNFTATAGSGNQIGGAINVLDDVNLLTGTATTLASPIGNFLVSGINIVNESNTTFSIGSNIYNTSAAANVAITTSGTGTITTPVLNTTGNVSLTSATGAITTTANASNAFSNVTVTSAGGTVSISTPKDLTVNATLTGSGATTAGFTSTAGAVTIGSFASNYTGTTTFDASGGKKAVSDSVAGIAIFGNVTLKGGSVSVTKSGHNFGGITIDTAANNGNVSLVESGTLKLLGATSGKGNISLQSTNGSIVQVAGTGIVNSGTVTATASSGVVTLTDGANNKMTGAVGLTASGDSSITQTTANALNLGNVTVSAGKFTVDVTGSTKDITQNTGNSINVYGDTSFTATGASKITVGNSGNKFGGLTLASAGAVTIKEQTTMNLKSVNTTGAAFTATSEGGSIVDSGSGTILLTGTSSFSAPNGNITLALAGSNYGTVSFTSGGNVSLSDTVGDLTLGGSTVGGTFTITNSSGNIGQSGALAISGDTTINATFATSNILLDNSANQFGALRFQVGTSGATITEATTMNLKGGTIANGPVVLNTGGNFLTSGSGASSFLSTNAVSPNAGLTITATGTIIPGSGSLLVVNGLTVFSNNTKDLSGLSLSGNLAGKAPTNLGTGTYVAPSL